MSSVAFSMHTPWAGSNRKPSFRSSISFRVRQPVDTFFLVPFLDYTSTYDFDRAVTLYILYNVASLDTEPLARSYSGRILTCSSFNYFPYDSCMALLCTGIILAVPQPKGLQPIKQSASNRRFFCDSFLGWPQRSKIYSFCVGFTILLEAPSSSERNASNPTASWISNFELTFVPQIVFAEPQVAFLVYRHHFIGAPKHLYPRRFDQVGHLLIVDPYFKERLLWFENI